MIMEKNVIYNSFDGFFLRLLWCGTRGITACFSGKHSTYIFNATAISCLFLKSKVINDTQEL